MEQSKPEVPKPLLTLTASIPEDAQRAGQMHDYFLSADLPDPLTAEGVEATGHLLAHYMVELLQEKAILPPLPSDGEGA